MKFGALPPIVLPFSAGAPTSSPVLRRLTTSGFAGLDTSIPQTENDSGALGSPNPGTCRPSNSTPCRASLLGYPKAGYVRPRGSAVPFVLVLVLVLVLVRSVVGSLGRGAGIGLYSNMPMLAT